MRFPPIFKYRPAIFVFFLTAQAYAQDQGQKRLEHIRTEVNLVTLRFTVRDSADNFINNIAKERFRVTEDGVSRNISFFEPSRNKTGKTDPLLLAFLLDVSGSTFATRSEEIIAAQTFLDNVHQFTQIGIFGFTEKLIAFQDFTSSREAALRAFNAARQHLGRTAIYDSLSTLISRMSDKEGGNRRAIVVVSDGMDNASSKSSKSVIAQARRKGVTLYTVLVPSAAQLYIGPASAVSDRSDGDWREHEAAFVSLSTETRGKHFSGYDMVLDFDGTLALINDDLLGHLYSIGYYTDDPYRDRWERDIRVQLDDPEARVSALFKSLPEPLHTKKKFIAALFEDQAILELPASFYTNFHEIGAEMDLLTPNSEGGQFGIPFRIKINPHSLRGTETKGLRTQFGVIGILLDKAGQTVVRLREFFRVNLDAREIRNGRGIIYTNKLLAPPGNYDLKIALLEIGSWKMTAFEDAVRTKE